MRPHTLEFRLALFQQLLAAALILVFSLSAIVLSERALDRQEIAFLSSAATQVAAALQREWNEEKELSRAARSVIDEAVPPGVRIDILDARLHTLASSAPTNQPALKHTMRELRVPVGRAAWVVASVATRARREAIAALGMALLVTGIPLFFAVAALSRLLARRMLQPLSRMAASAEGAAGHGVVSALGQPGDPAEVAVLADAFNRLLARLDATLQAERHFTEDAAHELRTPLMIVSGELELALSNPSLTTPQRTGLETASNQARLMGELVEALLFLRRSDPLPVAARGEFGPVNLSDLLRETVRDLLARVPTREADLSVEVDDEVLVTGHSALLGSALRNLVANALKFTQPGQRIRVSARLCAPDCSVVIEDAGKGVAPQERGRIFDPFYRDSEARAAHEGFGLGLAIIRRVARAHGGDVGVSESELGGARFELRLPCWKSA